MADNLNQGSEPRRYDESIVRSFEIYADALAVVQARATIHGINPRIELDESSQHEILEIRKLFDDMVYTGTLVDDGTGTLAPSGSTLTFSASGYPAPADPFYVSISGQTNRFTQYQPGDTIEIIDRDSLNEQTHMFFRLIETRNDPMVLKLQALPTSPIAASMTAPAVYRCFRRNVREFTDVKGAQPSVYRTKIISENMA